MKVEKVLLLSFGNWTLVSCDADRPLPFFLEWLGGIPLVRVGLR